MKLDYIRHHMKKRGKAVLCSLLAGTLLLMPCAAAGMGDILYRYTQTLSDGLVYEELYAQDGQYSQKGYLFTYTPGTATLPLITCGKTVFGRYTVAKMAQQLTDAGYTVVGGTNGDFFSMVTGIPLGLTMENGVILSSDAGENALGICADGSYLLGKPSIAVTMTKTGTVTEDTSAGEAAAAGSTETQASENIGQTATVSHINKYPSIWGAYLCTPDYGKNTRSTEAGTELVFSSVEGNFSVGGTVTAVISEVRTDCINGEIPADGLVLVVHNQYKNAKQFSSFAIGDKVSFTVSAAEGWENVVYAMGGGDILCENGTVCKNITNESHEYTVNPRTAIGFNAKGELLVFAVDGRSEESRGLTLDALAETMVSLGCVGAINLDGGGSTTVLVRGKGESATLSLVNTPAGGERAVSNAILFVNTAVSDGVPCFAGISPDAPLTYLDSAVQLSVTFYDRSYTPVSVDNASVVWKTTDGTIDANGRLTGFSSGSRPTVTAQVTLPAAAAEETSDGGTTQQQYWEISTTVQSIDTLDRLVADTTACTVPLGKISSPLEVHGEWMSYPVSVDSRYVQARFSSGGKVRCEYGVILPDLSIASTNDEADVGYGFPTELVRLSVDTSDGTVSAETSVTFGAAHTVVLSMEETNPKNVFKSEKNTTFSCASGKGTDGSNALSVSGKALIPRETPAAENPVVQMELYVKGEIPTDLSAVLSVGGKSVTLLWQVANDFSRLGGWKRLVLDMTGISAEGVSDFTIEKLLASEEGYTLIVDDLTYCFGDENVVFTDISDSWAKEDVLTAYRMGIVSGTPAADGSVSFVPGGVLRRDAFAKMIACFAGLEIPSKVDRETLPYADKDSIADWALPYIQAVTAAGLMNGKGGTDADGNAVLYFAAADEMTREEVLYVLATLLPEGEGAAELAFSDAGKISTWAEGKLSAIIGTGLVSGFSDGTLRPQAVISRAELASLLVRMHKYLTEYPV